MLLSVVVPALAEERYIGSTLEKIAARLKRMGLESSAEVIVVAADGGDNTAKIASSKNHLFKKLIVLEPGPKVGKGRDVRLGMLKARGEYVVVTDADLSTPTDYFEPMISMLESNKDLVIGVRDLKTIHESWHRMLGSVLTNLFLRILLRVKVKDTQCGFKGFRKKACRDLFGAQVVDGWGWDFEVLAIAADRGYKVGQIDILDWKDPKQHGLAGENQIVAMIKTLAEAFKVKINLLRGRYAADKAKTYKK